MEFDKSKVFTALNADELEVGSKVIVADSIHYLKEKVISNGKPTMLMEVRDDTFQYRFRTGEDEEEVFALAYFVEEPIENVLKWTDLKLLDKVVNNKTGKRCIVTAIDPCDKVFPVAFGLEWISSRDLADWEKED